MCGRYGRFSAVEAYAAIIDAMVSPRFEDSTSYNRPPGTFQLVGLINPSDGSTTLGPAWWGFVTSRSSKPKFSPINAKSETVAEVGMFAKAFEQQRCLVAADYWIEWQRNGDTKQPYAIRPSDAEPFFFAGIWSKAARLPEGHPPSGQVTFAILTGPPNDDIAHLHNRQPQALTAKGASHWIDPDLNVDQARQVLEDERHAQYQAWPIDKRVGSPSNDGPALIEPVEIPSE